MRTSAHVGQKCPTHRKPELLAPAGDFDAMRAAVANGADAVYFGLDNFNAHHRAAIRSSLFLLLMMKA